MEHSWSPLLRHWGLEADSSVWKCKVWVGIQKYLRPDLQALAG